MSIFSNLLSRRSTPPLEALKAEPRATLAVAGRWNASSSPRVTIYPPVDPGFPALEVEDILHGAQGKLQRLAEIAGGTDSEFERLYIGPIRKLAAQIHLLPATPYAHYSAPAGLFNMCLDIGIMSRQAAEGKMFVPEATIEVRHRAEPAWRYSAFLAGLLCQLHVPVGSLTVTDSKGAMWPRYGMSIASWLTANNLDRFYVTWHEKARVTGAEGASLLATVVPDEIMNWLAQTDGQIVRDLNIAVTREMSASESILGAIVRNVTSRVKEVDAVQQASRFGRLTVGTQFEVHMLNALRELIESKVWQVNTPSGQVFWGSDGLYVAWPSGLEDVLKIFDKRSLKAMPRSSVTLAEMLGLSGVVISKDEGVWVHDIVIPGGSGEASKVISAMRFKDPLVLLGHLAVSALTTPYGRTLVEAQAEQISEVAKSRIDTDSASPAAELSSSAESAPAPAAQARATEMPDDKSEPGARASSTAAASVERVVSGEPIKSAAELGDAPAGRRVPPELLARLKIRDSDDAANALGMIIEQSLAYRGDRVRTLDWGVAICIKWLRDVAGFDVADLAGPLERLGVIAKNPESRTVALISPVVFSDSPKPRQALAIKLDFAAKLGMPTDAKV